MEAFFREIGLPVTLRKLQIPDPARLEEMAAKCTERGPGGGIRRLDRRDVLKILKLAW